MTTSKSKALRNALKGKPSKATLPEILKRRLAQALDANIRSVNRKKGHELTANESVSESGQSSRGLAATISNRVSKASRGPKKKEKARPTSKAALRRKRRDSKTINLRGRYSEPDLKAVDDRQSAARAAGRRNKATAQIAALKKA